MLRTLRVFLLVLLVVFSTAVSAQETEPAREIRGVWVTNVDSDVLTSKEKIAEMMDFLKNTHINVVYPVVWNKAYTLYPSEVMEQEFGRRIDPLYGDRDPLQELIVEAHRVGIEVVPWFEYGFAGAYDTGAEGRHPGGPILEERPEWEAKDREGNLAEKNKFEWMNALDPEVQDFMARIVLEVAANYDVDGIQGDDRLPALPTLAGYDDKTVARYRKELGEDPPMDYRDPQWVQWRADLLSDWLAELYAKVKTIDERLVVSMSPNPYPWALNEYLQDSKTWMERGIVDTLHFQAYRRDLQSYQRVIDEMVDLFPSEEQRAKLAPGILIKLGSYRIPAKLLLDSIAYNRQKGVHGEVFFFYPGLRENDNELAVALRDGPYAEKAVLPYREEGERRLPAPITPVDVSALQGNWIESETVDGVFTLPAYEIGLAKMDVAVPGSTGIHDIYMKFPAGVTVSENAVYNWQMTTSAAGTSPPAQMPVELKHLENEAGGWYLIGRVYLPARETDLTLTLRNATGKEGMAVMGPVMVVHNRRLSRSYVPAPAAATPAPE